MRPRVAGESSAGQRHQQYADDDQDYENHHPKRPATWRQWGVSSAVKDAFASHPPPDFQEDLNGTFEKATVVAFNLGRCGGKLMYRAVEWYYPTRGETFNPRQYQDVCNGDYVG